MEKCNTRRAKQKTVSKRDSVYVGLDVHKRSVYAAVRINGELYKTKSLPAGPETVMKFLEKYLPGLKRVVYEAGPTGYGLARYLKSKGVPVEVLAPGNIPRAPGAKAKSDRLDCTKLAEEAENNRQLRPVAVPTEQQEARRQLIRLRNQVTEQKRRSKQRIRSLFLQYGIPEPVGSEFWNRKNRKEFRDLDLIPDLRFVLDNLLDDLTHWEERLKVVNGRLREMVKEPEHQKQLHLLQSHPGVGEVTAFQVLTELYQPERFENAKQVASYVGLAPSVRQSGETRKSGPLHKAGKNALRSALVESSWAWIRQDAEGARTFRRLARNTGNANKAIVGMARRLVIHLWTMLVTNQEYRAA